MEVLHFWHGNRRRGRRKKEEERYAQFEQEELARRAIDAEEEHFQYEQRKEAIERANKILHDSSDQVKAFHSKADNATLEISGERSLQQWTATIALTTITLIVNRT